MAWEILYEDGSWFTSDSGAYWQAPRYGVQGVLQADPWVGLKEVYSADGWWIWKDGVWHGTNREGADAYRLCHMSPEQCTLQGTWVRDDLWREEIQPKLAARKTSRYPYEGRVTQ